MSKILVVFAATGHQGGSVVNSVLEDATLSKEFKIRAVTRNASSDAAKALASKGVEVVETRLDDAGSVAAALEGSHTVFANTVTVFEDYEEETRLGKLIADKAVEAGAAFLVWSSVPSPTKVTHGKVTQVTSFETKVAVEDYIKTLPIKSAFYWPASFMQNFARPFRPQPADDGRFLIRNLFNKDTPLPLVDVDDSGKFVASLIADPDFFAGKHIAGVSGVYTPAQFAEIVGAATGKHVEYEQLADDAFKAPPPFNSVLVTSMMKYFRDYNYYGPAQDEEVQFALNHVRSKPRTLQEYLKANPLAL
ncbi:LAMI_0G01552g1_1 [Lachancea mirantina]|uniref:LAMI_0G01552g1_1 n=1 Tax=Lachancea mirantina TaxID=1230905 RepID=A0A1G4K7F8_9SACH|nr:LAMI_0G01552g1_1 [Lachancea mirantina]